MDDSSTPEPLKVITMEDLYYTIKEQPSLIGEDSHVHMERIHALISQDE